MTEHTFPRIVLMPEKLEKAKMRHPKGHNMCFQPCENFQHMLNSLSGHGAGSIMMKRGCIYAGRMRKVVGRRLGADVEMGGGGGDPIPNNDLLLTTGDCFGLERHICASRPSTWRNPLRTLLGSYEER